MRIWKYLGTGWDRSVYRIGDYVIKIPKHEYGEACNQYEADNWANTDGQCVHTRLLRLSTINSFLDDGGLMCAVQPFLTEIRWQDKPDWSGCYDCAQGGLNRHGKFQIYDFPPNWMGMASTVGGY